MVWLAHNFVCGGRSWDGMIKDIVCEGGEIFGVTNGGILCFRIWIIVDKLKMGFQVSLVYLTVPYPCFKTRLTVIITLYIE